MLHVGVFLEVSQGQTANETLPLATNIMTIQEHSPIIDMLLIGHKLKERFDQLTFTEKFGIIDYRIICEALLALDARCA